VMSINEIRELEELNSIGTAGDARLVQINQTTLDWLVANPGAKSSPTPAPRPADAPSAEDVPAPAPTNVIRMQALAWWREQGKQA